MKKKQWLYLGAFLLLFIYFISIPVHVFWDSGHYMSYVSIFEGKLPWHSWDIVRGIVFPGIIYISNLLFGKTVQGLLILTFLFYLIMLIVVKMILDQIFDKKDKKTKKVISIAIYSFLIFDPIIYGYYHTLLTEFVAMTISILMCYFAFRWISIDFWKERKKYTIYSCIFLIGTIFSWHLKQPYVTATIFPVIIAGVISLFRLWNRKNFIQRSVTILSCVFGLIVSMVLWNQFLISKGIDLNTNRNVTASFGNQLLFGLNNYELVDNYQSIDISYLSKREQQLLKKHPDQYVLVNVKKSKKKVIDQEIISLNDSKNISSSTAILFILRQLGKHPYLTIESYISNYLAIANLYSKDTNDGAVYWINKKFTLDYCHENCSIATGVANKKSNIAYMPSESYNRVSNYEQFNESSLVVRFVLKLFAYVTTNLFKFVILLLPILVVFSTISIVKNRNSKVESLLTIVSILSWYSFLHLLVHVMTGASIDRYASPAYIPILMSFILYSYYLIKIEGKQWYGKRKKNYINYSSF